LLVVLLLSAGTFGLRTYFRINPPAWLAFWQEEDTDLSTMFEEISESPIQPSEQTPSAPAPLSSEEPQEGEAPAPPAETPPDPEKAAEKPEPGPTRREPPPKPEPVAAPPSETGEEKLPFTRDAEARASLRRGRYTDAAGLWKKGLERIPSSRYAIQIAIFCEVSSIKRSWEESKENSLFYVVSSPFKGRPCYRACWGVYESRSEAERAHAAMPRYFRELKHKPQIVRVSSLR
jgi:septal ring-binding cell division protein DamX